jgi:hypothetical protein
MRFSLIMLADSDTQKVREQGGQYAVTPRAKGSILSIMYVSVCPSDHVCIYVYIYIYIYIYIYTYLPVYLSIYLSINSLNSL